MAPLLPEMRRRWGADVRVCVTGQHREMLDQVLDLFNIDPDFDLNVMKDGQDLTDVTVAVLIGLRQVFSQWKPDIVLVHGDTTTSFSAALAAFYAGIAVAHVEAGLRTGNILSPWPEEANRRISSIFARWHFAPTEEARMNLLREGVSSDSVFVTGNSVVDALLMTRDRIWSDPDLELQLKEEFHSIDFIKKVVLITGHRRENFGSGFDQICSAIAELATQYPDVEFVYPVHLNPNVQKPVRRIIGHFSNVHLIEPKPYCSFVYLMMKSYVILTDSGGIQEEAPSLGKPVLVMRKETERPEAVAAGTVKLVGSDADEIIQNVALLLDGGEDYLLMCNAHNPYGDGRAASRIATILYGS